MILILPCAYFVNEAGVAMKKIANEEEQWEEYDVVAIKDSPIETVNDINEKTVYALAGNSKMNLEARERLVTKADVEFEEEKDALSLANRLIDEKGNTQDNLIFLSKSLYDTQCENIDGFKKGTKVIYSIDVQKRTASEGSRIDVTKDPFNIYITGIDNVLELFVIGTIL